MNLKNNTHEKLPYPYIRETLLKDEKLVYVARPHWIVFFASVTAILMALMISQFGPSYFSLQIKVAGYDIYQLLAMLVFFVGLCWLTQACVRYYTSEYGITDKRVLMKTGWIQRNSLEIFLRKLEAIHVNQTILGRILNYGTIVIIGTGGTEDRYSYIPDPLGFRKRVQEQADLLIDEEK